MVYNQYKYDLILRSMEFDKIVYVTCNGTNYIHYLSKNDVVFTKLSDWYYKK